MDDSNDQVESTQTIRKGRGHNSHDSAKYEERGANYDSVNVENDKRQGPAKSIEGWIIFVTNVHPEAQEEDILDKFSEYGDVKNIHVNLDRRTGFVKGYVLLEYETYEQALSAIEGLNGKEIFGQQVSVDWAFMKR